MATGDTNDMMRRMIGVLPRWFPDAASATVIYGLLLGACVAMAQCHALLSYVRLQMRLQTSSDGWVDLASADYFGTGLPRKPGEPDAPFISRIMANLFPAKGTRNGIVKALTALTGIAPTIFEPARPQDAFSLGYSGLGYGRFGSYALNNQAFVTVYLPPSNGGALVAGLNSTYAGLGSPYLAMESAANLYNATQYADVYAIIQATKPIGSTIWTQITMQHQDRMHRQIEYPGQILADTELLTIQRDGLIALGWLAQAVLGTSAAATGLACTATSPASMSVLVGIGALYNTQNLDNAAYGSLAADTTVNSQIVSKV